MNDIRSPVNSPPRDMNPPLIAEEKTKSTLFPHITTVSIIHCTNLIAVLEIGVTPLQAAAWKGHLNVVTTLLAHPEVDVNREDMHGYTPLYGASFSGHPVINRALLLHPDVTSMSIMISFTPILDFCSIVNVMSSEHQC